MKENRNRIVKIVMIVFYLLLTFLPKIGNKINLDVQIWSYYVIPTLWCVGIFLYFRFVEKVHTQGRLKSRGNAKAWAFAAGGIIVVTRLLAGAFIDELGTSPYDHSFLGIIKNGYYVVPMLIARELIRSHCMNDTKKKHKLTMLIGLALCMTMANLKYTDIIAIDSIKEGTIFTLEVVLPNITENIFLNILALYGGSSACIIYGGILLAFEWLFPILPVLHWFTEAVISIGIVPLFAFKIYDLLQIHTLKGRDEDNKGFGVSLVIGVAIIWFFAGVFPIYPSIILTGSMEPLIYPGDIILIQKVTNNEEIEELKVGDIINFSRDDITIAHRIVEVLRDEAGNLSFRTKGDNNPSVDNELVHPNDVKGSIWKTIPKLGTPVVWLKSNEINSIEEEVNQP